MIPRRILTPGHDSKQIVTPGNDSTLNYDPRLNFTLNCDPDLWFHDKLLSGVGVTIQRGILTLGELLNVEFRLIYIIV